MHFRPLTVAEALRSPGFPGPPCASRPTPLILDHVDQPLPYRESTSIGLGPRRPIYFGTLHAHTAGSDGKGSVQKAYRWARDVAHLDFFAVTDHPEYWLLREKNHYAVQQEVARQAARPGFVPIYGFEYSSIVLGHYVVLNAPAVRNSFQDKNLAGFYDWLARPEQRSALVIFAHPGFHLYRASYEFHHFAFDARLKERMIGVEVFHWGDYTSFFHGYETGLPYIDEAIAQGWRVGALASQDVHNGKWGTRDGARIALPLPRLNKTEVLAALKARRFYATDNPDLQLALNVQKPDGDWAGMGETVHTTAQPSGAFVLKARYYDRGCLTGPYRLEVLVDGQVASAYETPPPRIPARTPYAGELTVNLPLADLPRHAHVYVRFFEGEGPAQKFAESSPIWLDSERHPGLKH